MKYQIKISYRTGDSFESEDTSDIIELSWDRLDVAKENLQAIKEHYKMYQDLNNYRPSKTRDEYYDENRNNFWFVKEYPEVCMKLKTDDGTLMQLSCFWCGYFEALYGAEILSEDSDMKFEL